SPFTSPTWTGMSDAPSWSSGDAVATRSVAVGADAGAAAPANTYTAPASVVRHVGDADALLRLDVGPHREAHEHGGSRGVVRLEEQRRLAEPEAERHL